MNVKLCNIWVDGNTPPARLHIEQQTGKAVPGINLVSAIQAHIHEVSTSGGENYTHMVPLLPYK